jgi:hypothetical protein
MIPRVAYAITLLHRSDEPADVNSPELQQLEKEIAAVEQRNNWAEYRRKPGLGTYSLAALLYVIPKVGSLKLVAVKGPTSRTEIDYIHSLVQSTGRLNSALRRFTPPTPAKAAETAAVLDGNPDASTGAAIASGATNAAANFWGPADPRHPLPNRDLDTGQPVRPAGYSLTDLTYAALVERLTAHPQQPIPPGIQADILAYYKDRSLPFATKRDPAAWERLQQHLAVLSTMPTSPEETPFVTYGDQ